MKLLRALTYASAFVLVVTLEARAQQHVLPRPAGAPEQGRMGFDGSYLVLGPTFSGALDRSTGDGLALGAELSFANVSDLLWVGAYADVCHGFAAEETRVSLGPEIGFAFLGVDLGYVVAAGGAGGTQHGLSLRPLLTIGFASAYFRSAWLWGSSADWFAELGVMLKLPMPLSNKGWL